jgi:hypothetical protein
MAHHDASCDFATNTDRASTGTKPPHQSKPASLLHPKTILLMQESGEGNTL